MAIRLSFPGFLTAGQTVDVVSSIGAHIAAKLDCFGSDEQTLTDELCDMFMIWALLPRSMPLGPLIPITLSKSTNAIEKVTGFDLAITVVDPGGNFKEALLQAKVVDPHTNQFRQNSAPKWDKLESQLQKMQNASVDGMFFLLVYVPGRRLDGAIHSHGSWEQRFIRRPTTGAQNSRFGTTVIAGTDLIDQNGKWKQPRVRYLRNGMFDPDGIALARLIVDMLLCTTGQWRSPNTDTPLSTSDPARSPRISFRIDFGPRDGRTLDPAQWSAFLNMLRQERGRT